MDQIKLDSDALQHLTYLYRAVYTTERAAGSDRENALRLANQAIEQVVVAVRPITPTDTVDQEDKP